MGIKASDIDIYEGYTQAESRKFISASLITFGYRIFKSAAVIQNLEELTRFYVADEATRLDLPNKFPDVLFESLMDKIRICISFENYFKAKLLLNGFIIHEIDKEKNRHLHKKQKQAPVAVHQLIGGEAFEQLPALKAVLKETTISFNTLICKRAYSKYYNLECSELQFLKDLNEGRNRLHLLISERFSISKHILSSYRRLKQLVDVDFAVLQNTLINEFDPSSKSKIPLNF